MSLLTIVVPACNEEENLALLYERLKNVLQQQLKTESYELIFVDDGSTDNTFGVIRSLAEADPAVRGISLSRNFGHQIALFAGMEYAKGDLIITMDADLQHPPDLIPEMVNKARQGYDIVNTRREDADDTGFCKRTSSRLFYRLINSLSDTRIETASSDFRLMNRKAADAFLNIPEQDRFTRGLVSWMGFSQAIVPYKAEARYKGKSKYSFRKMLRLGLDGLTAFSSKPLRLAFFMGLFVFLLGLAYAVYAIVQHVLGHTVTGWTSIMVSVLILGGVQLLSIGLLSEYILRIFTATKNRPKYFIRELTGH
jgi:polyisoprenyl-phosphate glycosyltransferase